MQKNKTPEISVIVPVYNVEKYIKRCLETIQKQTFTDFEVLVINDGTKDNSAVIAQQFCDNDERFFLFHKKNGGLSDARNYGIERAKGNYIVFIDSDDYLHKDYLKVLHDECINNDADMSYCRFEYSFFNVINMKMPISAKKEVLKKRDALNILIRDNFLHSYAWNKMYKRSLFIENNIKYPDMYFEDVATSGRILLHANKLAVSNRYLYYYLKRSNSIMSTMNARKINDLLYSILIMRNYLELNDVYDDYKVSLCLFAKKIRRVNWYSIIRQHIINLDFRKIKYNFDINKKIYLYIISDDYQYCDGMPEMPYHIHQPGRNKKNK